ncbi:hypothetical protein B0H14DRAFT_2621943 [Mycena olivaceomarginata]|nr:hypothetical protein B0H14DRAFT_2621943 [Mycena olivaceomarginata]
MLASILVIVRARWICEKPILYLSLYRLPYLRCRFDPTQAATAVASNRLDGGWTAPAFPGLRIVTTSICRTPVRFGVEPWTIELIASVQAGAIPVASDVFGLCRFYPTQPGHKTPVRFGVEPPFLNCATGVPPGSVRAIDTASTVFDFCVVLYLVFPECRLYPTQPGTQVDSYRLDSDVTASV